MRRFLRRDVDHPGVTGEVEMGELRDRSCVSDGTRRRQRRPRSGPVSATLRSMELADDPIDQIRRDGTELIRLTERGDLATTVPSCPDWSLADLGEHVVGVWAFWTGVVARGIDDLNGVKSIERLGSVEPSRCWWTHCTQPTSVSARR